jgi:hypothetical protein
MSPKPIRWSIKARFIADSKNDNFWSLKSIWGKGREKQSATPEEETY